MTSVFVVLCAVFAAVNAGNIASSGLLGYSAPVVATHAAVGSPIISSYHAAAPVAYAGHASAIAVPEISATHENVVRSYGGTFSEYSKGIETPFSSVRKYDSRISNNVYTPAIAATYAAHAPLATTYAAAAHAPVAATYAAHAPLATTYAAAAHAPVATTYAAHAPVAATYAAHAPLATTYAARAPVATTYAAHAPLATTYAAAAHAPVATTYAAHAPVAATYAAHAPLATTYAARAPVATTYAAHAPLAAHTIAYSPAVKVSHVSFTGLGAQYGW